MGVRTGQLFVAACFVVLTAAACGGTSGSATAGSGDVLSTGATPVATTTAAPPTVPTTNAAPPAGDRTPVPAGQISAAGMSAPPQGVELASGGRDVVFNAEEAGCQQITSQVTAQTATQVTIQVITTNTSKGNQMCPMIVRVVPVTAQLAAPLGGRTIVFQAVTKHG
jgi:hypothetical protein